MMAPSQQDSPPIAIIGIILNSFLPHRNLRLAARSLGEDPPPVFTNDSIVADMDQFGYVRIDALCVDGSARGARTWVVFLVLAGSKKPSNYKPEFSKLLEGINAERPTKEGRLNELIIIAEDPFFGKKNLTEVICNTRKKNQVDGPDLEGRAPFYSAYPYRNFTVVIPEHECVYPHRIMAPDEVKHFLKREHLKLQDLPAIYNNDPPVIWAGGRSGQVVEITRDSQTAGKAIYYRRIIPAGL